jgi:diguanylate cyclase (GGDEF)-like protein
VPIDPILALVTVALVANVALVVASTGRFGDAMRGLRRDEPDRAASRLAEARGDGPAVDGAAESSGVTGGFSSRLGDIHLDSRPASLERVVHVGTWIFLFAAAASVAVTGLWGERQGPVLLVLATAVGATLVLNELVRGWIPDAWLLAAEGATGLGFAGLLVGLTGGALSPFFFALPLIVVGAAIVVRPPVTLVLTAGAGIVYLVAIVAENAGAGSLSRLAIATASVNLMALCLVAYVGMAIGREQLRAREDADHRATVDVLTGLRTRAYLFSALDRELARSQRTGRSFCLLMMDLDDLKAVNDRHGHLVGDRVLQVVGDVIQAGIRRIDTAARFGGDEFVVLLPETDATGGWVLAEKIRQGVADAGIVADGARLPTSVSVGVATYPQDGATVGVLIERADAAMYGVKRSGRDRVAGIAVMDVAPAETGDPTHPV